MTHADRIVEVEGGWQVQSESGRPMGTYATKGEAQERLRQVEYFKHRGDVVRRDVITDYHGQPMSASVRVSDSAPGIRRHG